MSSKLEVGQRQGRGGCLSARSTDLSLSYTVKAPLRLSHVAAVRGRETFLLQEFPRPTRIESRQPPETKQRAKFSIFQSPAFGVVSNTRMCTKQGAALQTHTKHPGVKVSLLPRWIGALWEPRCAHASEALLGHTRLPRGCVVGLLKCMPTG